MEGGGELAAALLRGGLLDEIHWFVSARLLGSEGRPALGPLAVHSLAAAPVLEDVRIRRLGDDIQLSGRVCRRSGRRRGAGNGG